MDQKILLILVTFGIYLFWIQQWKWEHTAFEYVAPQVVAPAA